MGGGDLGVEGDLDFEGDGGLVMFGGFDNYFNVDISVSDVLCYVSPQGFLVMPFLCYYLQVHDCMIAIMGEGEQALETEERAELLNMFLISKYVSHGKLREAAR